jgi:hypothetical protein
MQLLIKQRSFIGKKKKNTRGGDRANKSCMIEETHKCILNPENKIEKE